MTTLRRRAAPPKLVALNNALVTAVVPSGVPDRASDPRTFGKLIENACLAHAWNAGQQVAYWREEPLEVDGVIDGSWGSWAVEVKTGTISAADVSGISAFTARHKRYRPLLVCDEDRVPVGRRLGVKAISWRAFLLDGPGHAG
jgi:predicted AAA+ superfamily ATPase